MKKHMKHIQQVLDDSPDCPGFGGGKWAFYSVRCCWWTSFPEDLGNTAKFMPGKLRIRTRSGVSEVDFDGLPCCPHCGSVLMQAPLEAFVEAAQDNPEHYGKFGIDAFLEAHSRNTDKCHAGWQGYNDDIWRRFHPNEPAYYA